MSVVSTTTAAQEMLSISPPKHHTASASRRSASPSHSYSPATVNRVQSSPQSARRTPGPAAADVIKEGLDILMLMDSDDNCNNSATAMSVSELNNSALVYYVEQCFSVLSSLELLI